MLDNVEKYLETLNKILVDPAEQKKLLEFVGDQVGTLAEGFPRDHYPPSPNGRPLAAFYTLNGKPSKFKSVKQRGWFFAALRDGKLKLPSVRTGFLGNSITHVVVIEGTEALINIGTVGSNLPYAKYVIGPPEVQSHYHIQTGWESLQTQLVQGLPEIEAQKAKATTSYVVAYMQKVGNQGAA
jgi:hypothetical protein